MPFVTEELWHLVAERNDEEAITISEWPKAEDHNEALIEEMKTAQEVITGVRTVRQENGIPERTALLMKVLDHGGRSNRFDPLIKKLAHLEEDLSSTDERIENAFSFMVGSNEYFIPYDILNTGDVVSNQIQEIEQELDRMRGFLEKSEKKLSNERFVENAPEEVVEKERQKKADAEAKIEVLKEKLEALKADS